MDKSVYCKYILFVSSMHINTLIEKKPSRLEPHTHTHTHTHILSHSYSIYSFLFPVKFFEEIFISNSFDSFFQVYIFVSGFCQNSIIFLIFFLLFLFVLAFVYLVTNRMLRFALFCHPLKFV